MKNEIIYFLNEANQLKITKVRAYFVFYAQQTCMVVPTLWQRENDGLPLFSRCHNVGATMHVCRASPLAWFDLHMYPISCFWLVCKSSSRACRYIRGRQLMLRLKLDQLIWVLYKCTDQSMTTFRRSLCITKY